MTSCYLSRSPETTEKGSMLQPTSRGRSRPFCRPSSLNSLWLNPLPLHPMSCALGSDSQPREASRVKKYGGASFRYHGFISAYCTNTFLDKGSTVRHVVVVNQRQRKEGFTSHFQSRVTGLGWLSLWREEKMHFMTSERW